MSKADLLLKKAASFEKLALYSDRKAFLQAVAQQYGDPSESLDPTAFSNRETEQWDSQTQPKGIPAPPPDAGFPMNPPPAMNAPAPREQQRSAPANGKIDPQIQTVLGLNPDGILGPQTRQKLDAYKQRMNMSSDQQAFAQILKDNKMMTQQPYSNIGQQGPIQPRKQ